ncbi:hypothetical protein [Methylobacillus glycogenes]|uniref:hypothetical protein n=1 Tax=Methylobacillus glycogenes TaxID=406 RepID=UPI001F2EF788|nr:hypothetical protein [Methylobacillus glycogenes]
MRKIQRAQHTAKAIEDLAMDLGQASGLVLIAEESRATATSAPPISKDSAPKPIKLKPLVAWAGKARPSSTVAAPRPASDMLMRKNEVFIE